MHTLTGSSMLVPIFTIPCVVYFDKRKTNLKMLRLAYGYFRSLWTISKPLLNQYYLKSGLEHQISENYAIYHTQTDFFVHFSF